MTTSILFWTSFIEEVERQKEEIHSSLDIKGVIKREDKKLEGEEKILNDILKGEPETTGVVREAVRNRSESAFYRLRQAAKNLPPSKDRESFLSSSEKGAELTAFLVRAETFFDQYGKRFFGKETPPIDETQKIIRRYEKLEELAGELTDAKDRGDIFGVNDEKLKEALGEERYSQFEKARDEILDKLAEHLQESGQAVREDDGVFKLTPASARRVGERTLAQLFAQLSFDGSGGHRVNASDEGSVAIEKTRPYEFGDAVTHLDVASTMVNAMKREGVGLPIKLSMDDFVIHETAGAARTAIALMIDMSGSMSRFGRFYNAKKMALAFDALLRSQYPEDAIFFVGFATFARKVGLGEILTLGPEQITMTGGGVNMKVDWTKVKNPEKELGHVPRYFTNMQKGLELSRRLLTSQPGENKEIIMITDGAPTAYEEGRKLCLCYPPTEAAYSATLSEVSACTEAGVTINTFLLGSDFDTGYFGEGDFIKRLVKINRGRLFQPEPDSLTRYVLTDYVANKKKMFEI